jgi:hypothetical protein
MTPTYYTGIKGRTIWKWDGETLQSRSDEFPQWRDVRSVTHEALIKMDNIHEIPKPEDEP